MNRTKGYISIAIATVLFSTMEIALKQVAGTFNPMQMTFTRFAIGGIVLLPIALGMLKKRGKHLSSSLIKKYILLGFIGVFVSMSFFQMAIIYSNASVVAVLFSSNPLFVTIFASLILGEKVEKKSIIAIVFEIIGILVIIKPWDTEVSILGVILTMLAAITFALYGVLGKEESVEYGGIVTTCFSFIFGSLEMIVIAALTHVGPIANMLTSKGLDTFANIPFFEGYSVGTILPVLYISIGVTGLGYVCYFVAMECLEAQTASLVFFFKPALAPILAMVILSEVIPANMIAGIALILVGSFASLFGDKVFKSLHEN